MNMNDTNIFMRLTLCLCMLITSSASYGYTNPTLPTDVFVEKQLDQTLLDAVDAFRDDPSILAIKALQDLKALVIESDLSLDPQFVSEFARQSGVTVEQLLAASVYQGDISVAQVNDIVHYGGIRTANIVIGVGVAMLVGFLVVLFRLENQLKRGGKEIGDSSSQTEESMVNACRRNDKGNLPCGLAR